MKPFQFFYNDGKPTQIRICLEDKDPLIKNKMLIIATREFTVPILLVYEKHFNRNKKKVVEYYTNDTLETFFETEVTSDGTLIEKGYGSDGELFFYRKYSSYDNYEINHDEWVLNIDGSRTEGEVGVPLKKIVL
jgi:hypothetical protein